MNAPRILVVDDEIIIARELENRLKGMGYIVPAIASSGKESVRLVGEHKPDLVLMDIVLKGDMDGIEAATEIRRTYQIPIIYLTAYTDDKTLERAAATEPFAYIVKPFSERELRANIQMALYRHRMDTRLRRIERWFVDVSHEEAVAVIAADTEGRITSFNRGAEVITAWERSQAIGKKFEEVFRLVDKRNGARVSFEGIEEGPVVALASESMLLDQQNTAIPVDMTTTLVRNERDEPTGTISVFRDASGSDMARWHR